MRVDFSCRDCGRNTVPQIGARGRRDRHEYYMVHDRVWVAAGMKRDTRTRRSGKLCIGCLERRLGQTLCRRDFTKVPVNALSDPRHTPRLRKRLVARLARQLKAPVRSPPRSGAK